MSKAAKARAAATKMALEYIERLLPKSGNKEMWEARFKRMSDKQFGEFMKELQDGTQVLGLVSPNLAESKIDPARNIKIARELGYEMFQRIWLKDPATGQEFLTPEKYLILKLPFRRQSQHLIKKMSTADDNDTRDDLTGQPTGKSKGSSVSNPEIQVLYALGLDRTIEELIKVRGGDHKAFVAMNKMTYETGGFDLDQVAKAGGTVKSTDTLAAYLKGCHINNNLSGNMASQVQAPSGIGYS